ncbi:MAG: hypothetical protein K2Y51_03370 [Gammaproteobacteria bacterium]|nr:hypothetical protein [Gammaproteobacteria bacterium]
MQRHAMLAACAALVCAAGNAQAATLVNFTFDNGTSFLNPSNVAAPVAGLTVNPWTIRDGTLSTTLRGNPDSGVAIGGNSFNDGNELRFTLNVVGTVLHLDGFSFDQQSSRVGGGNGAGPTDWVMFINDVQVANGAATRGNYGAVAGGLDLNISGDVQFRLFASGAELSTSTWRVDNFILTGSPVPLPATLPLLAGAAGLLAFRRRRG